MRARAASQAGPWQRERARALHRHIQGACDPPGTILRRAAAGATAAQVLCASRLKLQLACGQVNLRKRYFLAMLLYIPYILILLYLTLYVFPDRTMLLRSREARRAQLTATPAHAGNLPFEYWRALWMGTVPTGGTVARGAR